MREAQTWIQTRRPGPDCGLSGYLSVSSRDPVPQEHLEWGLKVEAASLPSFPLLDPRRKYTSLLNKID